jgi:hypothetical protein
VGKLYNPPPAFLRGIPLCKDRLVIGMDFSKLREVVGTDFLGVLGIDFLQDHVWRVDFDEGKLFILKTAPGKNGNRYPLGKGDDGCPTLIVQMGDWGSEAFHIDTGAVARESAVFKSSFFEFLNVMGRLTLLRGTLHEGASGTRVTRTCTGLPLNVGDFRISNAVFGETQHENAIGLGFLARFVVTFDFPNQSLYLEKGRAFDRPDKLDASGMHLVRREGKTIVFSIDKGSAAEKLAIMAGDIIATIGTLPAAEKSMFEIRRQLCEAGQTIPLTIQRGDQTLHVSVELKKY